MNVHAKNAFQERASNVNLCEECVPVALNIRLGRNTAPLGIQETSLDVNRTHVYLYLFSVEYCFGSDIRVILSVFEIMFRVVV